MSNLIEKRNRIREAVPHLASASGAIASFQTDMRAGLEEIKIHFNPQQASGTPSPTNVLPITGWTGCDLNRNGKNLFDISQVTQVTNGQIDGNYFVNTNTDTRTFFNLVVQMFHNTTYLGDVVGGRIEQTGRFTYAFSITNSETNIIRIKYNGVQRDLCIIYYPWSMGTFSGKISLDVTGYDPTTVGGLKFGNIQIEVGSTASSYEPYKGNQIPVSWSSLGTVYGGYVNEDGEVWANWKEYDFTGNETWSEYSGTYRATYLLSDISTTRYAETIMSQGTYNQYASTTQPRFSVTSVGTIYIRNSFTTLYPALSDWTTYLETSYNNGVPVQICYPLETPVLVGTISPIALKTLVGQNNIWANTNGDVDVKYWKH